MYHQTVETATQIAYEAAARVLTEARLLVGDEIEGSLGLNGHVEPDDLPPQNVDIVASDLRIEMKLQRSLILAGGFYARYSYRVTPRN